MTRGQALAQARKAKSDQKNFAAMPLPGGVPQIKTAKKRVDPPSDLDKMWHFQLCVELPENWFPVDKKTGKLNKAPFPRHYVVPNEGIAWDADFIDDNGSPSPRARKWRYIEGQSSIWVDEQAGLEMFDDKQIQQMLGQSENQIKFEYGQLHVPGIKKLKLAALQVQDSFEGKERQYQPILRAYRLLNPEKQLEKEMTLMDKQYAAEKLARELDTDQIIECAFVMGIDTTDLSNAGISRIRYEFLKKSKYDAANPEGIDWFMGIVKNPLTHVRYAFSTAMAEGLLSESQQPNKLTWAAANSAIMDVNSAGDVVDQLVHKWTDGDELTVKLLQEVENQLYETTEISE